MPNISDLVKKRSYGAKYWKLKKKKVTDSNIKQEELVNKFDISGFRNGSDINKKIKTLAKKEELNTEQDELVKVEKYDLSYFLSKKLLHIGDFPKMFVYQATLSTLQLQKDKSTDYVIHWKSKILYASTLSPKYIYFLHSIKTFWL